MKIIEQFIPENKWAEKCPFPLSPKYITIHERRSRMGADSAIRTIMEEGRAGFHIVVDAEQAIQIIPFSRNAFACGDGLNGKGNRESISVEICHAESYNGAYEESVANTIDVVKQLMKRFHISLKNIKQHHDWTGYDCPKRMRREGKWEEFLQALQD